MPIAALHPCGKLGCPHLVPRGKARCPGHERERDRRRGTAYERGYDARWKKYRDDYLKRHPLCVLHQAKGEIVPSTVVDHIIPHKGDEALFWAPSNHRAVCGPCHNQRVDEGDFGR